MIKIIADSTCDLSEEIVEKYQIGIAPLSINIDGKTYRDRIDITADEFFSKIAEYKRIPPRPCLLLPLLSIYMKKPIRVALKRSYVFVCLAKPAGSYQSAETPNPIFKTNILKKIM